MGEFNDFTSWISRQAAIFTFGVLGFANYIWGDNLFSCPCKDEWRRCIYTISHTFSPAFLVFVLDIHWKAVRANRKINGCSQSSFIIFRRPMILAVSWVVYSIIEPRFAECFKKEDNCTSNEEERKGEALTVIAAIILSLSILAVVAWFYWNMHHRSTFLSSRPQRKDDRLRSLEEESTLQKHLKGMSPKILSFLLNEDLMNLDLLKTLDPDDFKHFKDKLTMGQIKILKETLKKMNSPTPQGPGEGNAEGDDASDEKSTGCCCLSWCKRNTGYCKIDKDRKYQQSNEELVTLAGGDDSSENMSRPQASRV